ncbi:MAG: LpxD N-terminal domain-containing protein, partial [Weeksellaceae bacterium]
MKFTAAQIAEFIDGEIFGNPQTTVSDFGKIEDSNENSLTFLANEKYITHLGNSNAAVIIISERINIPQDSNKTFIKVKDAYASMTTLLNIYQELKLQAKTGIEDHTSIAKSATLGKNVYIGSFAYIGNKVKIGE